MLYHLVDTVPKTKPTDCGTVLIKRRLTCKIINIGQAYTFYLAGVPQGEEGSPVVQAEADQQWRVHQAEQGHHQHAQDLW